MTERFADTGMARPSPGATDTDAGIYWLLLGLGLGLMVLLPWQTIWVETDRGWFLQPRLGSLFGLALMVAFAAVRVGQALQRSGWRSVRLMSLLNALPGYRTALLSSALFFIYIHSLSVLGFTLSTLLFLATLLWLSRLLNRFWWLVTISTVAMLLLIFRVGVTLWMPDVWLYGLLPDTWADFANQYL